MRWVERERSWSSGDIVIGEFDVEGEAFEVGLGLGIRIWGSAEVEAAREEGGGRGGFMEKGFLEAEAIVVAGD